MARSYSNTRIPGLLAPLTTPGNVVFHGVTPGVRNMTLMGAPFRRETIGLREADERGREVGWQVPSSLSTCIVIEHPKAIGVLVPEELPCNDSMVLLDHLQVLLIEALPEPCFVLSLLKEPRGHVANNVHLQGRGARRAQRRPPQPFITTSQNLPSPQRQADRLRCITSQSPLLSRADSSPLCTQSGA